MVMVKVCGVRRIEDVRACRRARADLAGLNFVPTSRRQVSVEEAGRLITELGPVQPVGVFRDAPRALISETVERLGLPWIQLHGSEAAHDHGSISGRVRVIRAFRAPGPEKDELKAWIELGAIPLFDGPDPGSGREFDWHSLEFEGDFFVAGGLGPENVTEAIAATGATGVDTASGVERNGMIQDDLVQAFVRRARGEMEGTS